MITPGKGKYLLKNTLIFTREYSNWFQPNELDIT